MTGDVRRSGCGRPSRWGAAGLAIGVVVLVGGCGSSSKSASPKVSSSSPESAIEHPCTDATLSVPLGRQLNFTACGADAVVTTNDPTSVLSRLGSLSFIARAAGQVTIDISRGPACTPGQACSQVQRQVAHIVVKVS
jgi:hypothetical protein